MRTSILNLRSLMIAILLLVGMATLPLASLAGILGSRHDLSGNMGSNYSHGIVYNDYGQVCVYCHTPHDSNTGNGGKLLWNKPFSTASYTLYSSPTAKLPTSQPTGASSSSALCLSCHDGTIAVDALVNMPNQPFTPSGASGSPGANHRRMSGDVSADSCGGCHNPSGAAPAVAAAFLGTDLSNDHPVGMAYDNAINPGLNPVSAVTTAGMKLYGGKVECATCHDPHNVNYKAFLRVANTQSSMCTTCHLK
ncbi:MAG: cytochrome c3 family protein [Sulfurimicrobium sp.]|nr:cytochrome c3 family protein [Sulfurimicrobium sp.]